MDQSIPDTCSEDKNIDSFDAQATVELRAFKQDLSMFQLQTKPALPSSRRNCIAINCILVSAIFNCVLLTKPAVTL